MSTQSKILNYPENAMRDALTAVRAGMPVKTAARNFNVPRTTLLYKYKGKNPEGRKMGPDTIFQPEEEALLEKWVLDMAKSGFPLSKESFLHSVAKLAKELKKDFKNEMPGRKWYESFLRRHQAISLRTSQNLTKSRSAVTHIQLTRWFEEVYDYLKEINCSDTLLDPTKIFNADESAFFLNPKGSKVLASKGDKTIYSKINNNEKECYTVLVTANAAGQVAPPMVIFRYKRIPFDLSSSIPKHWGVGTSESGWMTADTFFCYITNVFYPWAKENVEFPIVFFVDGHASHMSYHLSKFCSDNKIILVALYPNSTHLLQPMDVAVFRTLKTGWKEQVVSWRMENQGDTLKKHNFVPLLDKAIKERVTPKILENGFRKTGLFPWNPEVVKELFPQVDRSTSNVNTPSKKNKSLLSVSCLEKYIKPETLARFNEHINEEEWTGQEKDHSLFHVWKKMKIEMSETEISNNIADMINAADIVFEDELNIDLFDVTLPENDVSIASAVSEVADKEGDVLGINVVASSEQGAYSQQKTVGDSSVLEPKAHEGESAETSPSLKATPCFSNNETSPEKIKSFDPDVPSPFKRALFWPEPNEKNVKSRKKEKIPSVVTSALWQQYNQKKLETKRQNEAKKAENKRKREEKKKEVPAKKETTCKKKKMESSVSSDSSDSSEYSEAENENEQSNSFENKENICAQIKIHDHVIVRYEGQHFPGQVQDVNEEDFLVSVMTPSGPSTWRWPEKRD